MTLEEARERYTSFVTKLLELMPTARYIYCDFSGSGDSFDSFHNYEVLDSDHNELHIPAALPSIEDNMQDIWWAVIEKLGAGFNDGGSRGEITIDLSTGKVSADFDWYVEETVHGGSLEDEQLSKLFNE